MQRIATMPVIAVVLAAGAMVMTSASAQELRNFTPEWNSRGRPAELALLNNWSEKGRPADDQYRPTISEQPHGDKSFTTDNMKTLYGHNSELLDHADAEAFVSTQGQGGYYLNRDFFPPARTVLDRCCPPEGGISLALADFGGAGFGYTDSDPRASHRPPMRPGLAASGATYWGWGDWTERPSTQASNPSRPI
jgi:hypothetical protein